MFNRSKMLLLSTLTICLLTLAVGCDQPEDVITPDGKAYLTLNPERLPNNPAETVYELWVASDTDTLSLGRFGYNFANRTFLTEDGDSNRTDAGRFYLDESIDNYHTILISVEPSVDAAPNSPSAIMLADNTSSLTIKLIMPYTDSLWNATARYNMVSVSDGSGFANDGSSIWFCNYDWSEKEIIDTIAIASWELDSGNYVGPNEFILDTIVLGIDTTTITTLDTIQVLGPDTLGIGIDTITRTIVRFDVIDTIVSSDYYPRSLKIVYTTTTRDIVEEKFTQDKFEVPNMQAFGWKYRGWVISDAITPAAVGNFTAPAWSFFDPILSNISGGLLTTGVFYDINKPDISNPFIDSTYKDPPRVPLYPGEDFINNLPAPLTSVPNLAGTPGYVFITLEPEFYNDTTNFPLLAYIGDLPFSSGGAFASTQSYTLSGYMYNNDVFRGFPLVWVSVEKL